MPESLKELAQRQIWDIEEEERLKIKMPLLQEVSNDISSKMKAQYEQNPYPRWVNLGIPINPQSVSQVVSGLNLKVADIGSFKNRSPNILIAGCGTGQHSIETSSQFKNSKVLGASLDELGLSFCGFADPQIVRQFKNQKSNENAQFDLTKWDSFERESCYLYWHVPILVPKDKIKATTFLLPIDIVDSRALAD